MSKMTQTLSCGKDSTLWRTCNKIRAAIFHENICLWDYYKPIDIQKNGLISESKFVSVLNGPLKQCIGLSDHEIAELADFFRVPDGRIYYKQFCEVLQCSVPEFQQNPPLVSGLEWEDPFHTNRLSMSEERRLQLMLCKIATLVNVRRLVIRPYFQDYELIAKNGGTVTIGHFARVLSFLGILLSAEDFQLLLKKFLKDSYTVNYVAFVAALDDVIKYLDKHEMLDLGGDLLAQFPGRAIIAELPKLPRPEIGTVPVAEIFGEQSAFHPVLRPPVRGEDLRRVMLRVQRHVLANRVRTADFFKEFDPFNSGRITASQFRRGLDQLGISGINRLYLSDMEIDMILTVYRDPNDNARMCWKRFQDDVDQVFTVKNLEKMPDHRVVAPPPQVLELPRRGAVSWHTTGAEVRDLCEHVLQQIKYKVAGRRILLQPCFHDYDRPNNGHVSRAQFRQCLAAHGLLCSPEELYALEQRYCSDVGFNYAWFLTELEPARTDHLQCGDVPVTEESKCKPPKHKEQDKEKNIVEILAKIKRQIVCRGIRAVEFMRDFDVHNQQCISRENFWRGLDNCGFQLTPTETETIMDVFASPLRRDAVDYARFRDAVEEAVSQCCLHRAPLLVPLQHLPPRDGDHNLLDYEERQAVSRALQKLARAVRERGDANLLPIFQDYDRSNCGSVSRDCLARALAVRNLSTTVTEEELQVLAKCFATERGMRHEFNYREFCHTLDLLDTATINKPF
ncbi:uncharacterized protein LOC134528020 [Bacillus rossius redtenbacheri]|uniref:uncharacterized protein LOC134528020 n=1 Tax=Bacillus rossius redtenbacheri TaxID=93214 RepID=UPI002FDD5A2B